MTIRAIWSISYSGTVYEIGSVIEGLPAKEAKRLVSEGFAVALSKEEIEVIAASQPLVGSENVEGNSELPVDEGVGEYVAPVTEE
ncbi:hypothetical protein [Paenibacillus sp. 481]|uniref:hypothetical protein n=1 Tax=Paenibacillus sp. 481 TaxID=2835869 RepID=UPI001E2994A9|nr:hypothetical protein [Paenibacillus sp. 481]UHA74468.1 hypothetical protein KIK04_05000 [Paenibacillus sp. 481]